MQNKRKLIYGGVLAAVLSAGVVVSAAHAQEISIGELVARMQELTKQVELLKKRLEPGRGASAAGLLRADIRYGARKNEGVRNLQQFLINHGYLEKDLATGNFFMATRDALRRFQRANGLSAAGVLDAKTRSVINGWIQRGVAPAAKTDAKTLTVKTATAKPLMATTSVAVASAMTAQSGYHIDPRPQYDMAAIERATFDAINAERQKNGLGVLTWNEAIAAVARAHSADQAGDNGVITDPDSACVYPFIRHEGFVSGFKVGDRLRQAGMEYRLAGENIIILPLTKALAYRSTVAVPACTQVVEPEGAPGETIEDARVRVGKIIAERVALVERQGKLRWINKEWESVADIASGSATDWMNSPGHRHNILTPEFEESATGAAIVNDYLIITQVFLRRLTL